VRNTSPESRARPAARDVRPAFYALERGGWRDYVTLLHPPYTLWHLSYVALGAGLAPRLDGPRLGATFAAFALALGVGAHALDELRGRPLPTEIPTPILVSLAAGSIAGAAAIGIAVALSFSLWLLAFVAVGSFIVVAYNLELPGFHTDLWFGLAWGGFPVLTAYFAMAERVRAEAVVAAAFATLFSLAQRTLSTPVRDARRRGGDLAVLVPAEQALRLLTLAATALGGAVLLSHLR
jgi:hypothetical protein